MQHKKKLEETYLANVISISPVVVKAIRCPQIESDKRSGCHSTSTDENPDVELTIRIDSTDFERETGSQMS
ncbi:hypothetical protein ABEB36_004220 [Hypothenemus hampei]|uniref:Uncharacterized protein n=1 Tax=Hypothenemus hampei TaxID=57062 RepID=A0ABD1F5A6_HYPHA